MIKVLIADDEKKICQLIQALVNWDELGMKVIGFAHDGIEALEHIEKQNPDLVITDIRMPGKDGLEIIESARENNPDLEFIVISGYKHFEYAQTAIKLGVNDYLLKPIKKTELLGTLSKIEEKFKFKYNQIDRDEKIKLNLKNNVEKIRSAFFADYLLREEVFGYENFSIEYFNSKYHLNFNEGLFQTIIVNVDTFEEAFYKDGMHVLGSKVEAIIELYLNEECIDLKTYIDGRRSITVLNYEVAQKETIRKKIRDILADILVQSNIFENIEITISIGEAYKEIFCLRDSFKDAEEKSLQRIVQGRSKIIESGISEESQKRIDQILSNFNKNISGAVEILEETLIEESLKTFEAEIRAEENINGKQVFEIIQEAVAIFLMMLRKYQFNTESTKELQEKFLKELQGCFSYEQLFEKLNSLIKSISSEVLTEKKQLEIKPIREAKQYIQANYMNHISLEEVSSVVGFSPAYFSSMFKKESGQNFMEYISEVRMNKAKEFLKTTSWSISVICESVGYSDIKHFTQSFKKQTGLKPNEFRKLYSWAGTD